MLCRDIKPGNILIGHDTLQLADFGTVATRTPDCPGARGIGTEGFVAPETADRCDFGVDVWATACTAFQVATGCTPFNNSELHDCEPCDGLQCFHWKMLHVCTLLSFFTPCADVVDTLTSDVCWSVADCFHRRCFNAWLLAFVAWIERGALRAGMAGCRCVVGAEAAEQEPRAASV